MNIDKMVEDRLIKIESDTEPAEAWFIESLKGDTFNPEVNTDIEPSLLAFEEKGFEKLAYAEGIYFYTSYYKCVCCGKWENSIGIGIFYRAQARGDYARFPNCETGGSTG